MSDASGRVRGHGSTGKKRGSRPVTAVSSHMVNYPLCLQAERPERMRQSLLGSRPACRARSTDASAYTESGR